MYTKQEILEKVKIKADRIKTEKKIIKGIDNVMSMNVENFSKIYAIKILVRDYK